MALSGCDNVAWGGIQVEVKEPPPPPGGSPAEVAEDSTRPAPASLPTEPILYLARRTDEGATILPVARLLGDTLGPLPAAISEQDFARRFDQERMAPGTEFVLFSQGGRVGTLEIRPHETSLDSTLCEPRPRASGVVELVPSAASARTFVALTRGAGEGFRRGTYTPHQSTYDQRVASINLASALIPRVGAAWPPSLVDARRDIQIFDFQGSSEPAIAATFLQEDRLATGRASGSAYSLFFIASYQAGAYRPDYVLYRDYARDGKGAPRYLTHFDWNADGRDEVLLEVFGETRRWLAAAGTRNGSWETVYQDSCGRPGSPTAAEE